MTQRGVCFHPSNSAKRDHPPFARTHKLKTYKNRQMLKCLCFLSLKFIPLHSDEDVGEIFNWLIILKDFYCHVLLFQGLEAYVLLSLYSSHKRPLVSAECSLVKQTISDCANCCIVPLTCAESASPCNSLRCVSPQGLTNICLL